MILPPPISTLSPYTTLFPSPPVRHAGTVVDAVVGGEPVTEILEHRAPRGAGDQPEARDDQRLVEDRHQEDLLLDRKSTRLNSSHTVISYAVFCLKKKKKQQL